jgi:hypothetical protein
MDFLKGLDLKAFDIEKVAGQALSVVEQLDEFPDRSKTAASDKVIVTSAGQYIQNQALTCNTMCQLRQTPTPCIMRSCWESQAGKLGVGRA